MQPGGFKGSFSRDGRTLAFLRRGSPGVWIASSPEAPPHLYEPSPFQATGSASLTHIIFAPDGKNILVRNTPRDREEEIWLLPWPPPGKARRVVFDMPEGAWASTGSYSWLPDSRHVLFHAMGKTSLVQRVFLGDVSTGRVWPVLVESRRSANPSVSPDGTKFVYMSVLSQFHVVEVPINGGPARNLLKSYQREYMPAFSPTERTLVYVTDRRGDLEVWMESLTEQWSRLLLKPSDFPMPVGRWFYFTTPVLSPDSQWVAVAGGDRLWTSGVSRQFRRLGRSQPRRLANLLPPGRPTGIGLPTCGPVKGGQLSPRSG